MRFFLLIAFVLLQLTESYGQIRFDKMNGDVDKQLEDLFKSKSPLLLYFPRYGEENKVKGTDAFTCFSSEENGTFFNKHFCCYALDSLAEMKLDTTTVWGLKRNPCVLLLAAGGEGFFCISANEHPDVLLRLGQVIIGEKEDANQVFNNWKKSSKKLSETQMLLREMGLLLPGMSREDSLSWDQKLSKIYKGYLGHKSIKELANVTDFGILVRFRGEYSKGISVAEKVFENRDRFYNAVGKVEVDRFLMEENNRLILTLAQAGNKNYIKPLQRVTGDMADVYESDDSTVGIDTILRYGAAGKYILNDKKYEAYVNLKNEYFDMPGERCQWQDRYDAVRELMIASDGQITADVAKSCIGWIDEIASHTDIPLKTRMRLVLSAAECYLSLGDTQLASLLFEEAFKFATVFMNKNIQGRVMYRMQEVLRRNNN